ncbi:MAG: hypothetical protein U1E30_12780 [Rhodoblastus sp.]
MHTDNEIRDDFCAAVDAYSRAPQSSTAREAVRGHADRLRECTDTMPRWVCDALEFRAGSSYANAAAIVLTHWH